MAGRSAAFDMRSVQQVREGVTMLRDVSLEIPAGRITALIGPSGSGKSSLLRLLNRLDDPVAGEIFYGGQPIGMLPVRALRRNVGYVFQTPVAFAGSVRDNLALAASIAQVADEAIDDLIDVNVRLADIDRALLDRPADRLSGGQLQRVAIGRALMTDPETLLMDEPTASLDPETAETLGRTITELSADRGLTVVMASHRLQEAQHLSSYAVMLDKGSVIEAGPTDAVFGSTHPRLRSFLDRVGAP